MGNSVSAGSAALAAAKYTNKTKSILNNALGDKPDTKEPTPAEQAQRAESQAETTRERQQLREDRRKEFEKKKKERKQQTNDLQKKWNSSHSQRKK